MNELKPVNQDFVCGGEVHSLEIARTEMLAYDLRRETYVHERPQPRGDDIISSTFANGAAATKRGSFSARSLIASVSGPVYL